MINNILKKIPACLLAALMMTMTFSSCENYDFPVDESHARMFSPVTFEVKSVAAVTVELTFSKVSNAESYIFEFSKDSLQFAEIAQTVTISADSLPEGSESATSVKYTMIFKNLDGSTRYSTRLKAVSGSSLPDSKWVTVTFVTLGEQIMKPVSRKTDSSALIEWTEGSQVSHLYLSDGINPPKTIELTSEDIQAGNKEITGLSPKTTYVVEIYNGTAKRGAQSFTTFQQIPVTGKVIYLDGDEDIDTYIKEITDPVVTLVFPANSSYTASWIDEEQNEVHTILLSPDIVSITFWGQEGGEQPILNTTSIKLTDATQKVVFHNMDIKGNSSAADYVINENATRQLSEVLFEDCHLHTFRGVFRMQKAENNSIIESIKFTGCTVHDIGGYGLINGAAAGAGFRYKTVLVENSTFYDFTEIFCAFYTPVLEGISLKNCTFYNSIGNGRYIFNFNNDAANVPPVFEIVNCIFGKFYYTTDLPVEGNSARATNPKMTNPFASGSYKTTDFILNTGYPLSGIIEYEKTSDELFEDPKNANFRIKDAGFPGASTAGDPRWRP